MREFPVIVKWEPGIIAFGIKTAASSSYLIALCRLSRCHYVVAGKIMTDCRAARAGVVAVGRRDEYRASVV